MIKETELPNPAWDLVRSPNGRQFVVLEDPLRSASQSGRAGRNPDAGAATAVAAEGPPTWPSGRTASWWPRPARATGTPAT